MRRSIMHELSTANPFWALAQMGLAILAINSLVGIPALKKIGIPAVSMGFALFMSSIFPKLLPSVFEIVFPEKPQWPFYIQILLITTLGAYAGGDFVWEQLKKMGKKGVQFITTSMIAPIICGAPVAIAFALIPNPFIQENANVLGAIVGLTLLIFMRALPTMAGFFRGNGWQNDMVTVSIIAASFDDLFVFLVGQPIIAGLMSGNGLAGIIDSAIGVAAVAGGLFVLAFLIRRLPQEQAYWPAVGVLFIAAGLAEVYFHVHVILAGIFWGMFMPRDIVHKFEHTTKYFVMHFFVPLFFVGISITNSLEIVAWEPWALMIPCLIAAFVAHKYITAPVGAKIFGNNKAAGEILGSLCMSHGTADITFASWLTTGVAIFTPLGLSGVILYLMTATIIAFYRAQSLVDANPALINAKIQIEELPSVAMEPGLVYATPDERED